jgi:hypothetical protein
MAFGNNSDRFLLKEGVLRVGTITNPENIGTNNTDPRTFFSGDDIGYIRRGTVSVNLNREYATFESDTPAEMIRKDLIRKSFNITFEHGQFNADVVELLKGTNSQKSYSVSTPNSQTWNLHHLGPDEPTKTRQAYELEAELTNGEIYIVYLYSGEMLAEDISEERSGDDYVVQSGNIQAFPHPNFTSSVTNARQKSYGLIAHKTA